VRFVPAGVDAQGLLPVCQDTPLCTRSQVENAWDRKRVADLRADPHGVYEACFLEEGEVLGCYGLLDPCLGSAVLWQSSASRAKAQSRFLLPALFGIGTALPVIAASVVLTLGARLPRASSTR